MGDIVYDRTRGLIYASTSARVPDIGNSVVAIEPVSGEIAFHVPIGSSPEPLAISHDDSLLYVGLRGADAIRVLELETRTARPMFPVGVDFVGEPLRAGEMGVVPGRPETVVVSRRDGFDMLAVYDEGVMRPGVSARTDEPYGIAVESESIVYACEAPGSSSDELMTYTMDETGVTLVSALPDVISGGAEIMLAGGLLYTAGGWLIDPTVPMVLGQFIAPGPGFSPDLAKSGVAPDPATGRVYFIAREYGFGPLLLLGFDTTTFLEVGRVGVPEVERDSRRLIRWGERGVAFIERETLDRENRFVVIVSSRLVLPPRG